MMKALLSMAIMVMMMPVALASELQSQLTVPNHHNFLDRPHIGQRIQHLLINLNLLLQQQLGEKVARKIVVHNCTIFLCSLDVRNIDDQCRGPNVKEKDHLDE